MKTIIKLGKLFPPSIRHGVRDAIQARKLRKALAPLRNTGAMNGTQIQAFADAWGNPGFAADNDYLAQVVGQLARGGPVLECGTGGTTLLANAMGQRMGFKTYCLEQDREWGDKAERMLGKQSAVEVIDTPLRDFGAYHWYDVRASLPSHFKLIVCDGPYIDKDLGEKHHAAWRYGILPWLKETARTFSVMLLDDVNDPRGPDILERWKHEFGVRVARLPSGTGECAVITPAT